MTIQFYLIDLEYITIMYEWNKSLLNTSRVRETDKIFPVSQKIARIQRSGSKEAKVEIPDAVTKSLNRETESSM